MEEVKCPGCGSNSWSQDLSSTLWREDDRKVIKEEYNCKSCGVKYVLVYRLSGIERV